MPAVIPFLSTSDTYPNDNSPGKPIIGPLQQIANITFQVTGNNVLYQVARVDKSGIPVWDETDLPAQPGSGGFSGRAYGIKFKSAVSGAPATISAIAFFADDAVPFQAVQAGNSGGSGTINDITSSTLVITNPTGPTVDIETPFTGTISDVTSTGGTISITNPTGPTVNLEVTTPGITGVGIQHNDIAVSTEPNLDFEDGVAITFTVVNDATNHRVKVTPISVAVTKPTTCNQIVSLLETLGFST